MAEPICQPARLNAKRDTHSKEVRPGNALYRLRILWNGVAIVLNVNVSEISTSVQVFSLSFCPLEGDCSLSSSELAL